MMHEQAYIGQELDLFAHATRWKAYWSRHLRPYLGEHILEVGAGLGTNTELLLGPGQKSWLCLEPDPVLAARLRDRVALLPSPSRIETRVGFVSDLPLEDLFDTILYIDVLEHIEHDAEELRTAAQHLRPGGKLIVLSPAHQILYSPFDQAIGHFRRYSRLSLRAVGPDSLLCERLFLLDAAGLLASIANRILLKQGMPTLKQINFWNRWLVPISEIVDPCLTYAIGKTVVGIWSRTVSST